MIGSGFSDTWTQNFVPYPDGSNLQEALLRELVRPELRERQQQVDAPNETVSGADGHVFAGLKSGAGPIVFPVAALIYITHDQSEAPALANDLIVMTVPPKAYHWGWTPARYRVRFTALRKRLRSLNGDCPYRP